MFPASRRQPYGAFLQACTELQIATLLFRTGACVSASLSQTKYFFSPPVCSCKGKAHREKDGRRSHGTSFISRTAHWWAETSMQEARLGVWVAFQRPIRSCSTAKRTS